MPSQFDTSTWVDSFMDKLNRPTFTCTCEEAEELLKIARERIAARKEHEDLEQLEALADRCGYDLLPRGPRTCD